MIDLTIFKHHSTVVDENEFFVQYLSESYPWRYDSNFFILKFQPYLQEFKLIEEMQLVSHRQNQMNHLRFFWPLNTGLTNEVTNYFNREAYMLDLLELYSIEPTSFKPSKGNDHVTVEIVNDQTLNAFKSFNYPSDKEYGLEFANKKRTFYDDLLENEHSRLYIATINHTVVGSLLTFESKQFIEIDDVLVHEDYRHQKIATSLQLKVMEEATEKDKTVILIADGEDSVKDMYQRQGYKLHGYHIGALKTLNH